MREPVHLISLGAGVQSSVMALMAARGLITPMPKAAIFADTQAEPAGVYRWLEWLEAQLPFPVYKVTQGSLADAELVVRRSKKSGRVYRRTLIPAFGRSLETELKAGILPRKCTRDYKIAPILRKARELGAVPRAKRDGVYVIQWIGISTDEAVRMKESRESWARSRWPLIEAGMSRKDCLTWAEAQGLPRPPRSACVFCPYHSDAEWVRLKTEEPTEFDRAVAFERQVHAAALRDEVSTVTPYLHVARVPLDQVTFKQSTERATLDGFGNECEGMCGI